MTPIINSCVSRMLLRWGFLLESRLCLHACLSVCLSNRFNTLVVFAALTNVCGVVDSIQTHSAALSQSSPLVGRSRSLTDAASSSWDRSVTRDRLKVSGTSHCRKMV